MYTYSLYTSIHVYICIYIYIILIDVHYPILLYSQSMLYGRSFSPARPDGGTLGTSWYDPQCIPGIGSDMFNILSPVIESLHTYIHTHLCV